jgi:hypothetical protein
MDTLIQDALEFLKEISKTTSSILATPEEITYFREISLLPEKIVSYHIKTSPTQIKLEIPPLASIPIPPKSSAKILPSPKTLSEPVETILPPPPTSKPATERRNLSDMRQLIQKIFPDLSLRETIPDDALAKRMSRLWEETYLSAQVVIIAFEEVGIGMEFLKNVTSAIDKLLLPAQLIEGSMLEKEQGWDLLLSSSSLKIIICSPWSSWKTTSLAKHYLQNGATGKQFLGKHRLLFLEPSLIYLKHPDRKRELWKILNMHLSS